MQQNVVYLNRQFVHGVGAVSYTHLGGMKFGEPSADGRGSAPPELAEQQA